MGTSDFGAAILQKLINNNYGPVLVLTAPDKPVGRKKIITFSPVKQICQRNGIAVLQPVKTKEAEEKIRKLNPDLIIIAAYGQIIPKSIFEIPKLGALNIHPSLLPKYRGTSPIQTAILNGEKITGITVFLIDQLIDHGPIIAQKKYSIPENIYYKDLERELSKLASEFIVEIIPKWLKGKLKALPQEEKLATYTKIIKKEDGKINWNRPAIQIERQIRAFQPWPGTFTFWENKNKKIIKIIQGRATESFLKEKPGKVFSTKKERMIVQCKKNGLIIEKLQLEGKNIMTAKEFILGHQGFVGAILK